MPRPPRPRDFGCAGLALGGVAVGLVYAGWAVVGDIDAASTSTHATVVGCGLAVGFVVAVVLLRVGHERAVRAFVGDRNMPGPGPPNG